GAAVCISRLLGAGEPQDGLQVTLPPERDPGWRDVADADRRGPGGGPAGDGAGAGIGALTRRPGRVSLQARLWRRTGTNAQCKPRRQNRSRCPDVSLTPPPPPATSTPPCPSPASSSTTAPTCRAIRKRRTVRTIRSSASPPGSASRRPPTRSITRPAR